MVATRRKHIRYKENSILKDLLVFERNALAHSQPIIQTISPSWLSCFSFVALEWRQMNAQEDIICRYLFMMGGEVCSAFSGKTVRYDSLFHISLCGVSPSVTTVLLALTMRLGEKSSSQDLNRQVLFWYSIQSEGHQPEWKLRHWIVHLAGVKLSVHILLLWFSGDASISHDRCPPTYIAFQPAWCSSPVS